MADTHPVRRRPFGPMGQTSWKTTSSRNTFRRHEPRRFLEHMRSIRPSWLLNIYLLLTVVFDIVRSRTYSLSPDLDAIATVFTSRVAVELILAIVEARPKRRLLLPEFADSPPETTSGPYKRALFWWLNALFKKGYSESLTVDDLFHLDKHLQSDYLHHLLGSSWDRCK
jgi:ATP-binding cassette subfamily C (CFTR/MRP) protein 1